MTFESRKLNNAERNYPIHEREMTVYYLRVWRHYLLGNHFTIFTDNVAATYFSSQPRITGKQARWQQLLAEYDFEILHKLGAQNVVADALSRSMIEELNVTSTVEPTTNLVQHVSTACERDSNS